GGGGDEFAATDPSVPPPTAEKTGGGQQDFNWLVINQTYPHWELWVVDDGSTDNTAKAVKEYLTDDRIHYVYQENQERSVARNHGLRLASGQYITFLDGDDALLPNKLETQVAYLEQNPEIGLCFGRPTVMGNTTATGMAIYFDPHKDAFEQLLTNSNFILVGTELTRREVFDKVGGFDETLPVYGCEDWDMWLRIAQQYPIRFIDEVNFLYRRHEENTSKHALRCSAEAVLKNTFARSNLPKNIANKKSEIYARFYFRECRGDLQFNQRRDAWQLWWQAVGYHPLSWIIVDVGQKATFELSLPYHIRTNLPAWKKHLTKGLGGKL
ncbi:MAG: glycosyltransferase family A protein, partial [Chloroflexota bacterium]